MILEKDLLCPYCGDASVVDDNDLGEYEPLNDRYKCPECGEIFYDVDGQLISEEPYNEMYDTSSLHPNESYDDFCDHEDFD